MFRIAFPVALFLCLILLLSPARPDERILRFDTEIAIQTDGSLEVVETIRVRAEGNKIKRGIYRDLPLLKKGFLGIVSRADFEIREILRDGSPEPWRRDSIPAGVRIYIGQENRLLNAGEYTYTIRYRMTRQIAIEKDYDELYWNAIGTEWEFPIDAGEATVILPLMESGGEDPVLSAIGFTGKSGGTAQDFRIDRLGSGQIAYTLSRPLKKKEGMTVRIRFAKGLIAPSAQSFGMDSPQEMLVLGTAAGLILLLLYYLAAWLLAGLDPAKGRILPLAEPPEGVTPAAMRYLRRYGFDNQVFTAALVSMASKGYLIIDKETSNFVLKRDWAGEEVLSDDEKAVADAIFHSDPEVPLTRGRRGTLLSAITRLKQMLALKYRGSHFKTNYGYLLPGILLSIAVLVLSLFASGLRWSDEAMKTSLFMLLWLSGWTVGVFFLSFTALMAWRYRQWKSAIFLSLFSLPFLGGEIVGLGVLFAHASILPIIVLTSLAFAGFLFTLYIPALTPQGRALMDRIEGFRMTLRGESSMRQKAYATEEEATAHFERFLPYAIALGEEDEWTRQFTESVDTALRIPETYRPRWYGYREDVSRGGIGLSGLGRSLSGAISSATASSSSGGRGGGGSSGGGGGGGGGGGW
jgi:uncharacterized membrane protein YgcG